MTDPLIGMSFDMSEFQLQSSYNDGQASRGGIGSQCFPVAELDDDFEGEPQDGMEYLFVVRREALAHPAINRVSNLNTFIELDEDERQPQVVESSKHISKPTEAWRASFVERFEELRQRMSNGPHISAFPAPTHAPLPMPQDESAWRMFVNGRKIRHPPPPKIERERDSRSSRGQESNDDIMTANMSLDQLKAAALASLDLETVPLSPSTGSSPPTPAKPDRSTGRTSVHEEPYLSFTIDPDNPPHAPSPAILLAMPTPQALQVLQHLDSMLTERLDEYEQASTFVPSTTMLPPSIRRKQQQSKSTRIPTAASQTPRARPRPASPMPSLHEAHWMLSLLTRIETILDGDDIATLRQVAKTVLQMLSEVDRATADAATMANTRGSNAMSVPRATQTLEDDELAEAKAHCWMIVAAIAGHWKQSDLWDHGL
ncbi:hypothetical protein OIO90_002262 [Microbotryomycetes sp. JL221]|nr:hypothetical protein OIO90_002262 [Microbotryomycetes sp. JL221]